MKVNNPLIPKLPIIVNNRSEAISVIKRLFNNGYTWCNRNKGDFNWIHQINIWGDKPMKIETPRNDKNFHALSKF